MTRSYEVLDETALAGGLRLLPGWQGDRNAVHREVQLPSFRHAVEVVRRLADAAEELDHHPDVDLRWRTLRLVLTTHAVGAVTATDLELAARIDAVVDAVAALPTEDVTPQHAGGALPEAPLPGTAPTTADTTG